MGFVSSKYNKLPQTYLPETAQVLSSGGRPEIECGQGCLLVLQDAEKSPVPCPTPAWTGLGFLLLTHQSCLSSRGLKGHQSLDSGPT